MLLLLQFLSSHSATPNYTKKSKYIFITPYVLDFQFTEFSYDLLSVFNSIVQVQ